MKKFIKLLLAGLLSVSLIGCSSSETDSSDSSTTDETSELDVVDYGYVIVDDVVHYYVAVKNTSESQTFAYPYVNLWMYDENGDKMYGYGVYVVEGIGAGDTYYACGTFEDDDFDSIGFEAGVMTTKSDSGLTDDAYPLSTDIDIVSSNEENSIICNITNKSSIDILSYVISVIYTKNGELVYCDLYEPTDLSTDEFEYEIDTSNIPEYDDYEIYCYANMLTSTYQD